MFQTVETIKTYIFKFFSENCAIYEIRSKNVMEPEGPQMTSQYGAYMLHAE
jgi:hypothetical protein